MSKTALVADDHELFRMALGGILRDRLGYDRVDTAESFEGALERLRARPRTGLVLIDLGMPGMAGAESLSTLRALAPDALVAVVSGSMDRDDMLSSLTAGVHGYVPKALSVDEMTAALARVEAGQLYFPPALARVRDLPRPEHAAGDPPADPDPEDPAPSAQTVAEPTTPSARATELPPRQRQILDLIRAGSTNDEIGRALGIRKGTVKAHVAALLKSLGVRNRAEAAAIKA